MKMNNCEFNAPVHFIGIGGCSMSGIAYVLLKKGYAVQGSDAQDNNSVRKLTSLGVNTYISHEARNVGEAKTIVYSNAVSADNPELKAAKEKGLRIFTRGGMLACLMNDSVNVAVCGTHGKTTTSSLIAFLFFKAGLDPTFIIGGTVEKLEGNARLGNSNLFVAEADESDGSFLMLSPSFEVITNIEEEHLDYYRNFSNIKKAFLKYILNIKEGGWLLACGDDEVVRGLLSKHKKEINSHIITYGMEPFNAMYAYDVCRRDGVTHFKVNFEGRPLGEFGISLLGIHNVKNALAAIASGLLNGIERGKIAEILPVFSGVERRFQLKGKYKGALVIDDYAHHPTEIAALLQSVNELSPKRKIAIFQPHRYTRTKYFAKEFAEVLKEADISVLFPIYPASEKPIPGVTSELICNYLKQYGRQSLYLQTQDDVVSYLKKTVQEGDIVMTVGAGNVYRIGEELVNE